MSVYDKAHALAKSIKQSEEYLNFKKAKEKLEKDPNNFEMLKNFRRKQWEVQLSEVAGEEVETDKKQYLEKTYQLLSLNPSTNEFLNAEFRLARMVNDIQRILAEALEDLSDWVDLGDQKGLVN